MPIRAPRIAVAAGMILVATAWASARADEPRPRDQPRRSAVERYGLGGHIQAIGLHHGFHIETVAPDSPADRDQLRAHDVIVKVDGEPIRSMDHLRAALAEAHADGGEVTITYTRGTSLAHRSMECHPRPAVDRVARRPRPGGDPR